MDFFKPYYKIIQYPEKQRKIAKRSENTTLLSHLCERIKEIM